MQNFKYFPHHVGGLFTLLIVSFAVQKLLSLIRWSHLSVFAFVVIAFGGFILKYLPISMSRMVLPSLSSRVFIVFYSITFKCLIYFELIFVKKGSSFNLQASINMVTSFSQHHLFNRKSFAHCFFLSALSKIRQL